MALGGFLLGRTLAAVLTVTLSTSMAARLGAIPMAAHQICLQVWLSASLLADAQAASGQVSIFYPLFIHLFPLWMSLQLHLHGDDGNNDNWIYEHQSMASICPHCRNLYDLTVWQTYIFIFHFAGSHCKFVCKTGLQQS